MNTSKLRDQLNLLGIDYEFEEQDDSCVIDLQDSDSWGRMFSLLEASSLEPEEEDDNLDLDTSRFTYISKDFRYELTSSFDNNEYLLIITEN